jgi:flagellar basal-body rod modification protein FlgD
MMATTSGIWNQPAPASSLANAHPATAAAGSAGTAASDGSSISANDFLTLLVTEMKNQDPTANTDPNAYVNQLVQVNSLEQLININQTLSTSLGSSGTPPAGGVITDPIASAAGATTPSSTATAPPLAPAARAVGPTHSPVSAAAAHTASTTGGNLSVPAVNPAAERVGHALGHHPRIN